MILIRLFSKLPLPFFYGLSELISFFLYYILRYRRSIVRRNLTTAFSDKNSKEIVKIEKGFYRNFPRVFLEILKSYSFTKERWSKHVQIENPELPVQYLEKGIPVVLMAGHTANWEWAAFAIGQITSYPFDFLYKPLKSKTFDRIMINLRERHGGVAVPKDDSVRHIVKKRSEARYIGMVADQLPSMGTEKVWTKFLHQETPFYAGAERIAKMMSYPVIYVDFRRASKGKYRLEFKEIAKPPYEKEQTGIITTFSTLLEDTIKSRPSDYLWSHNRWKYTEAEEEAHMASLQE